MPYDSITKILTSPVGIGDVQQAMSDYRYDDIGGLCLSDKLNHMAKYHPLKPTAFPIIHMPLSERQQRNYGWTNTYVEGVASLLDPWPQSPSNLPQFELKRSDDSTPWLYHTLWDFAEDARYGYYHEAPKRILYSCEGTSLVVDMVNPASGGARFMIIQDLVDYSAISGKVLNWNNRVLVDTGFTRWITADQKACSIYPEDLVFHSPGTGVNHSIYDQSCRLCVVILDITSPGVVQGSYQIFDAARVLGYPSTLEEAQEMLYVDLSAAEIPDSSHDYAAVLCVHARDEILQGNAITYKDIFIPIQGSSEHPTVVPFDMIYPQDGYDYLAIGLSVNNSSITAPNLTVRSRDSDIHIRMTIKNHTGVLSGTDAVTGPKWKLNIRFRGELYDANGYNYIVDETYSLPFEEYYPTTQQFLSLPDNENVAVAFKIPSDSKLFRVRTNPATGTDFVPVIGTLDVFSCELKFDNYSLNALPNQPSMSVALNPF